jgi:threonine synthase
MPMASASCLIGFRCVSCRREFDADTSRMTCPDCGTLLGTLDAVYDLSSLTKELTPESLRRNDDRTIRRYHSILPIRDIDAYPAIPVGMTPLYPLRTGADSSSPLSLRLLIKDDTRNPSGSTKDRATAIGIARARELGAHAVAAASTGNAASSLATFAAREGFPCMIFAPETAPPAKLAQIRIHGAVLFAIQGTYDDAFDLCMEACARLGLYNRNTAVNPYLGEGKKTLALEIWEQLGFRAPETVVVPVGDGCIIGGVHKGFRDLLEAGSITRMPRLIGAQAEGSAALAAAWRDGLDRVEPCAARTVADSISVGLPRDQIKALRAVRESQGRFVTASDDAILEAMDQLGRRCGIFVEPAAAAPFAAVRAAIADGAIGVDEEVVLIHTGHGLKDIDAARRASAHNESISIPPTMEALERALAERERG